MMVNMNGLSYGTWRNIQKAIKQFDVPMKSAGNYLLKLQEVFTPGHTRPPETWGRLTWRRC